MNTGAIKSGGIIAAVVALLVGGVSGYAIGMGIENKPETKPSSQTMAPTNKANELRVGMNNLLREHVSSSLVVTRNIVDVKPQDVVDASVAAQMANAGDIATAVGTVYGDEAKEQITGMFVNHIKESNKYVAAVAAGDEQAKMMAVTELKEYLNDISAFFSGAINDLPKDDVYALLEKHETLLNDSIDAYKAGDFTRSYELEREALTQVSTIADALSSGIVATKPELFK